MAVQIRIQNPHAAGESVTAVRQGVVDTMAVVARSWHDQYLPAHFTVAGGKKYGYQPRSGDDEPPRVALQVPGGGTTYRTNQKYSWRKRRKMRHNRPLVWSGESEEMAMAAVRVSARRRRGGEIEAAAVMQLPKYFFQYLKPGVYHANRGGKLVRFAVEREQPHKHDELTRVTPDEAAALTRIADGELRRRITGSGGGTFSGSSGARVGAAVQR